MGFTERIPVALHYKVTICAHSLRNVSSHVVCEILIDFVKPEQAGIAHDLAEL